MLYSQALICLHRSFKPLRSEMTFSFKRQDAYGVGSFDDISIQTVSMCRGDKGVYGLVKNKSRLKFILSPRIV